MSKGIFMSQDDERNPRYYDMSEAAREVVDSDGAKGKVFAGAKLLGKLTSNIIGFGFREVLPAAIESQRRTSSKLLQRDDLTDAQRDRLEKANTKASNLISELERSEQAAKKRDLAAAKKKTLKERATPEREAATETKMETTRTINPDTRVRSDTKTAPTNVLVNDSISQTPKIRKQGRRKLIIFSSLSLLISIYIYAVYPNKTEPSITSNDRNSIASNGGESIESSYRKAEEAAPGVSVHAAPSMENMNTSVIDEIKQFQILHEQDSDCGTLDDVYCKSDLIKQAASNAYSSSLLCEQGKATGKDVCFSTSNQFIDHEFQKLELEKLNTAKYNLERAIGSKKANHFAVIEQLTEACKKEAIAAGHRDDFLEYTRSTCYPEAEKVYLQPEQDTLKKVNARLEELNYEPPEVKRPLHNELYLNRR